MKDVRQNKKAAQKCLRIAEEWSFIDEPPFDAIQCNGTKADIF